MTNESIDREEFGEYISQVAASRILGISKQAVTRLVRRGYFNTREVAGRKLILRSEAESLAARPKGRPRQGASGTQKSPKTSVTSEHMASSQKYISRAEAARIRGVSQPAIADLIRRGRFTTISAAGRTLLLRSEVETFIPQPVGHPSKTKSNTKKTLPKKSKK